MKSRRGIKVVKLQLRRAERKILKEGRWEVQTQLITSEIPTAESSKDTNWLALSITKNLAGIIQRRDDNPNKKKANKPQQRPTKWKTEFLKSSRDTGKSPSCLLFMSTWYFSSLIARTVELLILSPSRLPIAKTGIISKGKEKVEVTTTENKSYLG